MIDEFLSIVFNWRRRLVHCAIVVVAASAAAPSFGSSERGGMGSFALRGGDAATVTTARWTGRPPNIYSLNIAPEQLLQVTPVAFFMHDLVLSERSSTAGIAMRAAVAVRKNSADLTVCTQRAEGFAVVTTLTVLVMTQVPAQTLILTLAMSDALAGDHVF